MTPDSINPTIIGLKEVPTEILKEVCSTAMGVATQYHLSIDEMENLEVKLAKGCKELPSITIKDIRIELISRN